MNDTTQLEHALRAIAEAGGEPDEDEAWDAIQATVAEDAGASRRRRRLAALATTTAIGAAAAALVVVTTRPATQQAVEVGPAAPGTEAPVDGGRAEDPAGDVQEQVGTPVTEPEDPAVTISNDFRQLNVMDAATGQHFATPAIALGDDEGIVDGTVTSAGDVYFTLSVPESSVLARTRWDGAGEYEVLDFASPPMREGGGYGGPVVDPAGERLAFEIFGAPADSDPEDPMAWEGSIGILDLQRNELRHLEWPDRDDRAPLKGPQGLSFSPDGTQLSFVNVHDSDGTELFEVYVLDLATARSLADARLVGAAFDAVFGPDGRVHGLVDKAEGRFEVLEGGGEPLGGLPGTVSISATTRHTILAYTGDRWSRHVAGDEWAATGWDGWHD